MEKNPGFSSDSDFHEEPTRKRKAETREPDNVEKDSEEAIAPHGLRTRTSPKVLFDAVHGLTVDQRNAVTSMGLGSLLEMTLDGIPAKMGYYVVDHLDPIYMRLQLKTGYLQITDESIHAMLGLPLHGIDLEEVEPINGDDNLATQWRQQFGKGRTSSKDVLEQIKKMKDAGTLFKLNFLMIVINVLSECSRVGECKYRFLSKVARVDMIPRINWCRFVHKSLSDSKIGWRRDNKDSYYASPLTYLTLLYVESTDSAGMDLAISTNPLKRWTMELLR